MARKAATITAEDVAQMNRSIDEELKRQPPTEGQSEEMSRFEAAVRIMLRYKPSKGE